MEGKYKITDSEFWVDKYGNHPTFFTVITIDDIERGKWKPSDKNINQRNILKYLKSFIKVKKEIPIENNYDRIYVLLTASGLLYSDNQSSKNYELCKLNIPICMAKSHIALFKGIEKSEYNISKVILKTAKQVHEICIDVDRKYIKIGDLVEYTHNEDDRDSESFFERWTKHKELILEFRVVDFNNKDRFCLRGFWLKNKWDLLDIYPSPLFKHVISD